jgi:arylsulfatase A-like enzyme
MLRHLEACGLHRNTIVVVYSDHGMEFFEHETWGQGNSAMGDFSSRIPLLVFDPRRRGIGPSDRVVRSVDIAPTLIELAGGKPPDGMDGCSLVPLLDGTRRVPELDAFNETGVWVTHVPGLPEDHLRYPDLFQLLEVPDHASGTLAIKEVFRDVTIAARDRMIRAGRWKLVWQPLNEGHRLSLFDLSADPGCTKNVAADHPDVVVELSTRLEAWMRPSERAADRRRVVARPP